MKRRAGVGMAVIGALALVTAFGFIVERGGMHTASSTGSVTPQTVKEAVAPDTTSDSNYSGSNVAAMPAAGEVRVGATPAQAPVLGSTDETNAAGLSH